MGRRLPVMSTGRKASIYAVSRRFLTSVNVSLRQLTRKQGASFCEPGGGGAARRRTRGSHSPLPKKPTGKPGNPRGCMSETEFGVS